MYGSTRRQYTYYRCAINEKNHGHMPWYPSHPPNLLIREDILLDPIARFFTQRIFGPNRKILLADTLPAMTSSDPELQARRVAIQAEITELQRRQTNLMRELETLTPTGDPDVDQAWRAGIQARFAANIAEQRTKTKLLTAITREQQDTTPPDLDLIDAVPLSGLDVALLPEDTQRRLYDTFHLEIRYNARRREAILRITIDAETAPALTQAVNTVLNAATPGHSLETAKPAVGAEAPAAGRAVCDVLSAPGDQSTWDESISRGSTITVVVPAGPPDLNGGAARALLRLLCHVFDKRAVPGEELP